MAKRFQQLPRSGSTDLLGGRIRAVAEGDSFPDSRDRAFERITPPVLGASESNPALPI